MTYSSKGITSPDKSIMYGVSAIGRAVGRRGQNASTYKAYALDYLTGTPTPYYLTTLNDGLNSGNTQQGELFAVSQDGTGVFGRSFLTGTSGDYYSFKTTITGFGPAKVQGAVNALPELPGVGVSTLRTVAYGASPDGKYAVGKHYPGMDKATVWDTSSADPSKWTILDLTQLASANGGVGIFDGNLRTAYSLGTNATDLIITGLGVYYYAYPNFYTRAFVMTVPKWVAAIQFPVSVTVAIGANVTFSLKTNGLDSLTYQWYKNGAELTGETGTSLSLTDVSCPKAGNYTVVVNNAPVSGVVTGAMTLAVLDPFITTQPSPSSRTNAEGSAVTYTVAAGGTGTLSYQWQRNGSNLSDGTTSWGSVIAGASTATLTISNLKPEDGTNSPGSGIYRAVATTSPGGCTANSQAVTLKVMPRPVLHSIAAQGADYVLEISGPTGRSFSVLYSTDITLSLGSWTLLYSDTFAEGTQYVYDFAPADAQRFYILMYSY
jgi:hypothetical protein